MIVTAMWSRAIVFGINYYSIFEIDRKYYIIRPWDTPIKDIESQINFHAGMFNEIKQNYTREYMLKGGDENGVLDVITNVKPTWKVEGEKCECGGWICGEGLHDHWCPAFESYED